MSASASSLTTSDEAAPGHPGMAVLALLFNAFVWGVSWWPFRYLQGLGLHPLWTTALVYVLAVALIALRWPGAMRELLRTPVLWVLVLASGSTNAAFNWAVSIGDVVRVVLLFYLMPLWTVLLARLLLDERLGKLAALRVVLALAGALAVLSPGSIDATAAWPVPSGLADWLGVAGGFFFALNNVMLRREAQRSAQAKGLAMFLGGVLVAGGMAIVLSAAGAVALPPVPQAQWVLPALALALAFLTSNMALQYGASRLRANATSVVMISEVGFASVSAVLLGSQKLATSLLLGGGLILSAAVLAALEPRERDVAL